MELTLPDTPLAFHGALLTLVALVPLMFAERAESRTGRLLTKPFASAGFLWFGVQMGALDTGPGQALFVGLCLAAVGDVLLIFPGRGPFLAGLVAFLLGHVGYTVAFGMAGVNLAWAGLAAALLVPYAGLVYTDLRPKLPADMVVPVVAYMVVITAMVVVAVGTVGAHPGLWIAPAAAFLFYLSDISVALDRFAGAGFGNRALGLPLYYVAQLGVALTALGFVHVATG